MTLDKTLQKIIQRAEFDHETDQAFGKASTRLKDSEIKVREALDLFGRDRFLHGAQWENARLLPMIKGLCEEVQRLRTALKFYGDRYNWYSDIGKKDFYIIATQDVEQLATDDIDVVGGKTARQALKRSDEIGKGKDGKS